MSNSQILIVAFLLGQIGYAAVSTYIVQLKFPDINYFKAAKLYFDKEIGGLVMAAAGWAIIMFVAPDYLDTKITKADLYNKETLTLKEQVVLHFRLFTTLLGMFIQHILFVTFKKGKKAIADYSKQNNLDANV